MDLLRSFTKWITNRRAFSILITLFLFLFIFGIRFIIRCSEGTLSTPLTRGTIIESVYGIGTVTANKSYQVKPGIISTINTLYVKEGDQVKKGDPLVKIDVVTYRAPFNGVISFLPFKVGENIFPQLPVLALVDLADRYLVVSLEQQGALQVKPDQKAKISFDTIREQNYEGKVESVYSYNGNFLARVNVDSLPNRILPDMTADVAIEINRHENALIAPLAAVENGIMLVKRGYGIPHPVAVKIGIVDKDMAEIISGDLQPSDQVIIRKKVGS